MFSRFTHVVAGVSGWFLFVGEYRSSVWMWRILLVHTPAESQLGHGHRPATAGRSAQDLSEYLPSLLLGNPVLVVESLGHLAIGLPDF